MSEPQIWAIIGLFFTTQVFLVTLVLRTVKAEIGALGGRMEALEGRLTGRIDALSAHVVTLDREVTRLTEWRFKKEDDK